MFLLKNKKQSAFTFAEILVVVFLTSLIGSLVIISISSSRSRGRDLKTINNITQLQSALETYKDIEGGYPAEIVIGESLSGSLPSVIYLDKVPENIEYQFSSSTLRYSIDFEIENPVTNFSAGKKCATPDGIFDNSCP